MSPIPAVLRSLVDDAAVFPPARMPLPEAVAAHRVHRASWYSDLVGPFLCPASMLDQLEVLVRDDDPIEVAVVVDTGTAGILEAVDAVAKDDRLTLRGVEVPLRGEPLADNARRVVAGLDAALGGPDDEEPAYVEIPRLPGWKAALDVIAESGYRAKLRTGGDDVPTDREVAEFIVSCLDRGVVFKLTAGLHHAVRPAADGGHGFLNVFLAVAAALEATADDAEAALALTDAARIVDEVRAVSTPTVRKWFASYGSCSIDEPLADLTGFGLIRKPT